MPCNDCVTSVSPPGDSRGVSTCQCEAGVNEIGRAATELACRRTIRNFIVRIDRLLDTHLDIVVSERRKWSSGVRYSSCSCLLSLPQEINF